MRTSLDLPDDLYRTIKRRAALSGLTVRELVIHYLQQGLSLPDARSGQKVRPAPPIMIPSSGHVIRPVTRSRAARMEEAKPARPARTKARPSRPIGTAVGRIQQRLSRLPIRDSRSADEIIGYDQRGLPD